MIVGHSELGRPERFVLFGRRECHQPCPHCLGGRSAERLQEEAADLFKFPDGVECRAEAGL
jgi:hypothetical protein